MANELIGNKIIFVTNIKDDLAIKLIKKNNYDIKIYKDNNAISTIIACKPDLIINDILDTKFNYTNYFKKRGVYQINF